MSSTLLAKVLLLVCIISYFIVPMKYDIVFCNIALYIFVVDVIILFKNIKIKNDYFHILFIVSFFACNFVYPCFVYPIDPYYFRVFSFLSSDVGITQATMLASLGFSAYVVGYCSFGIKKMKIDNSSILISYSISKKAILLLTILMTLFFILFLISADSDFYQGKFNTLKGVSVYLSLLFKFTYLSLLIFVFYSKRHLIKNKTYSFFKYINPLILIIGFIYIFLQFRVGERGEIIQILLLLFLLYVLYVKSVDLKYFLIIAAFGALTMSYIMQNRGESNPLENNSLRVNDISNPLIDIGLDLIVNNVTLIESVNYVEEKGYTYGLSELGSILQSIPFSQSIVYPLFNVDEQKVSSANLMTTYMFGNLGKEATFGLGTNMNADLYLVFGPFFLILAMIFFGRLIAKLSYKAVLKNDLLSLMLYAQCFILAVYLPRTSIFVLIQPFAWSYLLYKFAVKSTSIVGK